MINLALYREYRPKTFDEVIGQDHIITTLKNQIISESLSHAYLFCGTRGTGKTSTAKIFAKAINCEHNKNGSPCLECNTCKELSSSSSLDILEIDAASNNRVDEIRELRDKIKYPPVVGKYKVYIIDEVHMLTDSAYNALLKTLEEPPKHAVFILCTTEVHKLPKTILSRCMRFDFKLVSNENLVKLLTRICTEKQISFEPEALNLIASRGEGCVRDTLSIADLCVSYTNKNLTFEKCLEALGASNTDGLNELCDGLAYSDGEKLLVTLDKFAKSGKNFTILNKELLNHLKTLLTIKTVKNAQNFLMMPDEYFSKMKNEADKFSANTLLEIMTKLASIETQLKYSIDAKTMLEITLLGLISDEAQKKTIDESENAQKKTKIDDNSNNVKNEVINSKIIIEDDQANNVFDNVSLNKKDNVENKNLSFTVVVAKILKYLRENDFHLLGSVYQNFVKAKIENNKLIISFHGENFKEILENSDNINLINSIIKEYNLTVEYEFSQNEESENIENILKQKFSEIEIKE